MAWSADIKTNDGLENLIDLSGLETLRALAEPGEADPVHQLIEIFLNSAPLRMANIEEALLTRQLDIIHRESHTLKSSAGNFRAKVLATLCAEIEHSTRDRTTIDLTELRSLESLVARVKTEFGGVIRALYKELGKGDIAATLESELSSNST